QQPDGMAEDVSMGLAGAAPRLAPGHAASVHLDPTEVSGRIGTLTADDLARGVALSQRIPAEYRALASEQSNAVPLLLAMLIDGRPDGRDRQLQAVTARLGARPAGTAARLADQLDRLDPMLRLPVVELATPALVSRPQTERDAIVVAFDELARADSMI